MKLLRKTLLTVLFGVILGGSQIMAMCQSPQLALLLENMKLYKTLNKRFHEGHLYEHSIWVTRSIINLLYTKPKWGKEINVYELIRPLIVAGLLHDIGKGGNTNNYIFFEKPEHPTIGFQYLLEIRPYEFQTYLINRIDIFNFTQLFKELNFSDDERKFVAIIAGMHHELGIIMRGKEIRRAIRSKEGIYNTRSAERIFDQELIEQSLIKLDNLIQLSKYKGGNIPRGSPDYMQLIACICLVSAADVLGAEMVCHEERHNIIYKSIGIDLSLEATMRPRALSNGGPKDWYKRFDYDVKGVDAKESLMTAASASIPIPSKRYKAQEFSESL